MDYRISDKGLLALLRWAGATPWATFGDIVQIAVVERGWMEPVTDAEMHYGIEERHDRPRPFSHHHYHAHYGHPEQQEGTPTRHDGEFSHPHRHGLDDDHHR